MPSASTKPEPIAQILFKKDYTKQSIITLSSSSSELETPLPPSAIRVKTTLIALTANNLGYAALGTQLHWWDAFPVPSSALPPFNDSSAYAILRAWGYATVLGSTTSIAPGSVLRGFWPVSTHQRPSQGHHVFISALHRGLSAPFAPSPLDEPASNTLQQPAKTALLKPVWEAAYLLNRFLPMHPFGSGTSTTEDGDLSSAIVVIVAASGKTAEAFASEIRFARAPGTGPLAILSVVSKIPNQEIPQSNEPSSSPALRNTTYTSMAESSTPMALLVPDRLPNQNLRCSRSRFSCGDIG
ncbi:MAG: hypothetical protein Q9199_007749 [Rusavskia elegans]